VPVSLALDTELDGKMLEHFFFLVLETVEFPYGAAVDITGRTVAVLLMTTTSPLVLASTFALATAAEATTTAEVAAAAVSV